MSENELKVCPSCGGPAIKVTKPMGICSLPAIKCGDENCQNDAVVAGSSYQEAAELWNTRPVEDMLREQIKARDIVIDTLRGQVRTFMLASSDDLRELKY